VLSLTVTVSYGVLMYAYPVVLPAMQAELGWAQQVLTGAWSVGALVSGAAAVPVGRWIDRHGPRGVMTVCAVAASILVAAWSRVHSPALLYAVWVGLGACSAGLFYEPAFATIAQWFHGRRAQAVTIVTVAGGLASTIFVPLTTQLTQHLGWRDAVLCLAVVLAALTIPPHALLPRGRPRETRHGDDSGRAKRSPPRNPSAREYAGDALRAASFRWLILGFALSTLAATAFVLHLIPILLAFGHDLAVASLALAAAGVAKLVGRVLFAPLLRRADIVHVGVLVHVSQALGVLVLVMTPSLNGVVACVLLFGMGEGAATAARAEFIAEFYGSTQYGTVSGVMALFLAAARALGPVTASLALSMTGAYDATLVALVVTLLLAGAALRWAGATATRAVPGRCVLSSARTSIGEESDIPHLEEGVL
jgi:MFS family permease